MPVYEVVNLSPTEESTQLRNTNKPCCSLYLQVQSRVQAAVQQGPEAAVRQPVPRQVRARRQGRRGGGRGRRLPRTQHRHPGKDQGSILVILIHS